MSSLLSWNPGRKALFIQALWDYLGGMVLSLFRGVWLSSWAGASANAAMSWAATHIWAEGNGGRTKSGRVGQAGCRQEGSVFWLGDPVKQNRWGEAQDPKKFGFS